MTSTRSTRQLANTAVALLVAVAAVRAGTVAGSWGTVALIWASGVATPWRALRLQHLGGVFGLAEMTLALTCGVAFVGWHASVHDRWSRLPEPQAAEAWPGRVVWWFIPVANLVKPYRDLRGAYLRFADQPRPSVVRGWWAAFLAMVFSARLGQASGAFAAVHAVATVVGATLAIRVVVAIERGLEGQGPVAPGGARGLLAFASRAPLRAVLGAGAVTGVTVLVACLAFPPAVDPGPHKRKGTLAFIEDTVTVTGLTWRFTESRDPLGAREYVLDVSSRVALSKPLPERVAAAPVQVSYTLSDSHGGALRDLLARESLRAGEGTTVSGQVRLPLAEARRVRDVRVNVEWDEARIADCRLGLMPCPMGFACTKQGACLVDRKHPLVKGLELDGSGECAVAGRLLGAECAAAFARHFSTADGAGEGEAGTLSRANFAIAICGLAGRAKVARCVEEGPPGHPCDASSAEGADLVTRACDVAWSEKQHAHFERTLVGFPSRARGEACAAVPRELAAVHHRNCLVPQPD